MDYIFRCVFGFLMTFVGCEIAIMLASRRIRMKRRELEKLKASLTKPESYVWIDVTDHLPTRDGLYLIEYSFKSFQFSRSYIVLRFCVDEQRFQNINLLDVSVIRWAELPK